jgi:predicted component of type VI protein secretion system
MNYEKTAPTLRSLEMPRLVVELPDGKEVHHHLADGEVTIGRDPQNRIAIADNFISKFHAKLIVSKTNLVLVDLDSANKTYVNDAPITEAPVRFGDKIRFAAVKCRLEAPGQQGKKAPAVAPPPPSGASVDAPRRAPSPPAPALSHQRPAPSAPPPPAAKPSARAPAKSVAPPRAKPPGSAPPPIEADPMKRLLRIGGLLILVSLALAIMLRVLLVPSETPAESEASTTGGADTAASPGEAPPATPPPSQPAPSTLTTVAPSATADAGQRGQNAEYYFDEGLAHLDTGRLREARTSFNEALAIDPEHARARTRLSLLEEEIEKKAERHFDNGRQAFQFLRYEEAIAEWEMFLQLAEGSDARYQEAQQGIEQAQAKLR